MTAIRYVASPDGTRIAYRASGSGEPVLFVHGASTSGADWVFVRRLLRDRFTVVTMDRRGRGDSGDGALDYSIEREAEDVLAVLDAVGAEQLVGHSYGGLCSILAAQRTTSLRRLVLYEPPIAVREDRVVGLEELVANDKDAAVEAFLRSAGIPSDQLDAIRSTPAWPVLLDAVPALPRELRACAEWRNPQRPIKVPTLFLLGGDTDNPAYLDGLDELQATFPEARRELIPGQRHAGHVFAAEIFTDLIASFCAPEPALRGVD